MEKLLLYPIQPSRYELLSEVLTITSTALLRLNDVLFSMRFPVEMRYLRIEQRDIDCTHRTCGEVPTSARGVLRGRGSAEL